MEIEFTEHNYETNNPVWKVYNSLSKEGEGISQEQVIKYNTEVQRAKGIEGDSPHWQDSFKKLGLETWEKRTLSGEEVLELQTYISLAGNSPSTLKLWREYGNNVTARDIVNQINQLKEEGVSAEEYPWFESIFNLDEKEIEEKMAKGEIFPPLLFFSVVNGEEKEWGLLNLGNVLDGNNRILNIAEYLRRNPEKVEAFKLDVLIGHANLKQYVKFMAAYLVKPERKNIQYLYKKYLKKEEVNKIPREHNIRFFERWYLLLQRIGYFKNKEV